MKAVVISVGTELLIGTTLNTHSQYLSQTLNAIGIGVVFHMSVGDNPDRIKQAIPLAESLGDLIIFTGGLGPTQDDLTRYALSEYLEVPIIQDPETKAHLEGFFARIGREMTINNLRQADFPQGAVILENHYGTAKGFMLKKENKTYVALPGPPKELRNMVENELLARLTREKGTIHSKFLRVYGVGESLLEDQIQDIIEHQSDITVAPYVGANDVALRVTTLRNSAEEAERDILPLVNQLKERLGIFLYSENNEDLAEALIRELKSRALTVATAESCTGGLVASKITKVSGASEVFLQGAVTYSNAAKVKTLNVSQATLEAHGAVSAQTALEMAEGLKAASGCDCGVAITGIAGPSGGTEEKPVGTVFIAAYVMDKKKVFAFKLWGDRERIQQRAANHALFILYYLLQNKENELENL